MGYTIDQTTGLVLDSSGNVVPGATSIDSGTGLPVDASGNIIGGGGQSTPAAGADAPSTQSYAPGYIDPGSGQVWNGAAFYTESTSLVYWDPNATSPEAEGFGAYVTAPNTFWDPSGNGGTGGYALFPGTGASPAAEGGGAAPAGTGTGAGTGKGGAKGAKGGAAGGSGADSTGGGTGASGQGGTGTGGPIPGMWTTDPDTGGTVIWNGGSYVAPAEGHSSSEMYYDAFQGTWNGLQWIPNPGSAPQPQGSAPQPQGSTPQPQSSAPQQGGGQQPQSRPQNYIPVGGTAPPGSASAAPPFTTPGGAAPPSYSPGGAAPPSYSPGGAPAMAGGAAAAPGATAAPSAPRGGAASAAAPGQKPTQSTAAKSNTLRNVAIGGGVVVTLALVVFLATRPKVPAGSSGKARAREG